MSVNPRRTQYNPFEDEWWVRCDAGHEHYGEHGAAGLLLRMWSEPGEAWAYLLQKRAAWVDHGGTWSVPSGALHQGEDVRSGALREAHEEGVGDLDIAPGDPLDPLVFTADHGGWAFHTVLVTVASAPEITDTAESTLHQWFSLEQARTLDLHPGFAAFLTTFEEI